MSNEKPLPKIITLDNLKHLPDKPNTGMPPGLKEIDGAAIAAVQPDNNGIKEQAKVVRGEGIANQDEFNLHPDGTLMKWIDRPDATLPDGRKVSLAPQKLLVDGKGQLFGIARNEDVANLICNGVNALNLAQVMMLAEDREKLLAKQKEENPTGAPPALLLPPSIT